MKKTFELTVDEITDACHLWLVHTNRFPNCKQTRVSIKFTYLSEQPKATDIAADVELETLDEQQHKQ